MPRKAVRVAVIGVGQMGAAHAQVYRQHPRAELVAVADVSEKRCREVGASLGVPAFADYRAILSRDDVDAVDICVPDQLHREPAVAAAQAGKHVTIEKPLATTPQDAEAIIEACRRHRVTLMVAHLLRFDPRYARVKEAIAAGEMGEVTHITTHRNSPWTIGPARYAPGTSLTMHVAVHDLDLVNWYLSPARPISVYARAVRKRLRDRQMDDSASAIVEFDSGAVANVQYSWALPPQSVASLDARLELIGTEGMAIVGNYHGQSVFLASTAAGVSAPDVHHNVLLNGLRTGDLYEEVSAFVRCIQDGTPSPVPGEDALLAVLEADAIERSARDGQAVRL